MLPKEKEVDEARRAHGIDANTPARAVERLEKKHPTLRAARIHRELVVRGYEGQLRKC